MKQEVLDRLPEFMDVLELEEEPMGIFFTDRRPEEGFSPKPMDMPTLEMEQRGEVDWGEVFGNFSCAVGNIWRARRKNTAAWFSARRFGCPGSAFWQGFNKPQLDMIVRYVSTGIPGHMEGEHYCASPETTRRIFDELDPVSAPEPYLVYKPLSQFGEDETPLVVAFFTRPEPLSGLHQLAAYVTGDPDVVRSPWAAACGGLVAWPLKYLEQGENKAVLGGWDPSARKFYAPDELSFTVPFPMLESMLEQWEESFLTRKSWPTVRKKAGRSKRAWGRG